MASGTITVNLGGGKPTPGATTGKKVVKETKTYVGSNGGYTLNYTYSDGSHSSKVFGVTNAKPETGYAYVYNNYLTRLGIGKSGAVSSLVSKAIAGKWDLTLFDRELRQNATAAYMNSRGGKADQANFLQSWQTYFPGAKPAKTDYMNYIKGGYAAGAMNSAELKQYIMSTKQFKQQFVAKGFNQASYEVRNNPAEFQSYAQTFKNIMAGYGLDVGNPQYKLFFGGQQTPDQFATNAQTVFGGTPFYNSWTGKPMAQQQENEALYGGKGGQNYQSQIVKAYNASTAFMKSTPNSFSTALNPAGNGGVNQPTAFANST